MADQELIIKLEAQIGDVLSKLDAVSAKVASVGRSASAGVAPVRGFGTAITAFMGGAAFAAAERMVRVLVAFGKSAVDAFAKADSAARQFQNTLEQRGLSTQEAVGAVNAVAGMAVPAGFEPEVIQQAIGNMVIKMNSGADAALGMSVAMDNARAKGITLATSVQQVSIAALGSLKALRQFGITTNKDVNGNLKDANTLLKEMAANVKGGLETYMNSPLGMIDRMKVAMQELKEEIGRGLTELFAPRATFMTGFSQGLVNLIAVTIPAGDALTSFAIKGIQTSTILGNMRFAVQTLIAALDPANWFNKKRFDMIWDQLEQEWIDFRILQENLLRDTQNMTPGDQVKAYLADIERLFAKLKAEGNDASGTADKWEAAFAPLKLLSGNIPQLAKYVGNLSSNFVLRSEVVVKFEGPSGGGGGGGPSPPQGTLPIGQRTFTAGSVQAAANAIVSQVKRGVAPAISSHGADLWKKTLGSPLWGGGG